MALKSQMQLQKRKLAVVDNESKMLEQDARLLEHEHVLLHERRFHAGGGAEEVGK